MGYHARGSESHEERAHSSDHLSYDHHSIAEVISTQKAFFFDGKTSSIEFRDRMLRLLYDSLLEHKNPLLEALKKDQGRPAFEAYSAEIGFVLMEIKTLRKHLKTLMSPRSVGTSLITAPAKGVLMWEPKGTVLIMSPWNYPVQLLLGPLVGALASGNTAILKPSEFTPHTNGVLCDILRALYPEALVATFLGGASVAEALLDHAYDHIFFTGSTRVGQIVAEKAARFLTPVTLELGGKSPAIVHKDANLELAAKRIVWGKFLNAGQTCIAPDFVYVQWDVRDEFVELCKKRIKAQFGSTPKESPDYGRIISEAHAERLVKLLESGTVIEGGIASIKDRFISPTLLGGVDWDRPVMQEEIFGPLLPILTYDRLEDAVVALRSRPKPLAFYLFSNDEDIQKTLIRQIRFGGGCVNDTILQVLNDRLPFGGVGQSGQGSYHGVQSFKEFSHQKSLVYQSTKIDLPLRYPPYRSWKMKIAEWLLR